MSRVTFFRTLVVLSVVFHAAWLVLPFVFEAPPGPLSEALRWQGYGGVASLQQPLFYAGVGAAKLIAAVGLFMLLFWGRWLLGIVLAVSLAQLPFNGLGISLPHESVLGALTGLIDGAVLALAFVLPTSQRWLTTSASKISSDAGAS
jgi:hypothetical protein